MSLKWDVEDVKDNEDLFTEGPHGRELKSIPNTLVWMTMAIDIGEVTENNFEEVWARLLIVFEQDIYSIRDDDGNQRAFTKDEVKRHIGLWTNVPYRCWDRWFHEKIRKDTEFDESIPRSLAIELEGWEYDHKIPQSFRDHGVFLLEHATIKDD